MKEGTYLEKSNRFSKHKNHVELGGLACAYIGVPVDFIFANSKDLGYQDERINLWMVLLKFGILKTEQNSGQLPTDNAELYVLDPDNGDIKKTFYTF
ncbi:16119_t:CDS:2, partial [Entrophospora sp. SA101]